MVQRSSREAVGEATRSETRQTSVRALVCGSTFAAVMGLAGTGIMGTVFVETLSKGHTGASAVLGAITAGETLIGAFGVLGLRKAVKRATDQALQD